jgi:ferredoxin/predicted CopG family antitoxin
MDDEERISLSSKAYAILTKAKKKGETFSDVVLRLTSTKVTGLQKRGENEILTSDGRRLAVSVEQDLCLGAESCVSVAPTVFALDRYSLGLTRKETEPLGVMEVEEMSVGSETILRAAESCPYKAIHVKDLETGEELTN